MEEVARPSAVRNAIRIPKTAELVAANIRKMIVRGEVKEGDFLQPEAQLMEHFGTSRPTIREAFRILENEQLISVTRGSRSGARVHAPRVDSVARYAGFALQAQGALLSDIYLAREGIEPYAARIAAARATPEQVAAYRAAIDATAVIHAARGSNTEFRLATARLHHLMVEMAGSNTLTMISAMLHGVVEQHMSRFVSRPTTSAGAADNHPRKALAGIRSFQKLANLIEAHDADGAEAHWRAHLKNANASWLSGYDRTALVDVLD
ncbi:MAG: FadR family transcriptional regulator [Phenylobacterium sp.]|nr:FadR family transcriptional regulator [Phenylobacterium sp.]